MCFWKENENLNGDISKIHVIFFISYIEKKTLMRGVDVSEGTNQVPGVEKCCGYEVATGRKPEG